MEQQDNFTEILFWILGAFAIPIFIAGFYHLNNLISIYI